MTDRIASLTVALDKDMREDDVENLMSAIAQMRNVAMVSKDTPINSNEWVERARIRAELAEHIWRLVHEGPEAAARHILKLDPK